MPRNIFECNIINHACFDSVYCKWFPNRKFFLILNFTKLTENFVYAPGFTDSTVKMKLYNYRSDHHWK